MDYSVNIEFTEKIQAQSAHYSGRQQTCHCSLIEGPTGKMYVYHLSDDTNHNSIMTFTIIRDLIERYPAIITDERLVLHSDNASSQYKCRYTFYEMRKIGHGKLAMETVAWFYGDPGHGKGNVRYVNFWM